MATTLERMATLGLFPLLIQRLLEVISQRGALRSTKYVGGIRITRAWSSDPHLEPIRRVPSVLDGIIGSSGKHLGDLFDDEIVQWKCQ